MLIQGNALHVPLADRTVHCAVESPPYWGLREYNLSPTFWPAVDYAPLPGLPPIHVPAMVCCLGNEETVEAYVGHMVLVGREHRRVLRSDGTWWLNLGDSYAQDSKWGGQSGQKSRGQLALGLAPSGFTLAEAGRSVCATFSEAEAAEAVVDLDRTQEVVAVAVK